EGALGITNGVAQSFHGDVAERIGTQKAADFVRSIGGGDELFLGRGVDAVIARGNRWRTTDAHVDFRGAGLAATTNDFARGGAADDGIVDENDAFAFHEAANGVELELHTEIADGLRWLNEGAADVVIANEAHAERNFRFKRVADGGGNAGVRHRYDDIGV